MSKEEREKGWSDFHSAVIEQYQKGGETEKQEFNPNGNAKQGQETFEKVVATISNYYLFPEEEISPDNSPEAQTAIKDLEEILDQTKPNIKNDPKLLEKTIQDLENFEKNNENNGGKNNYAWVKLGGGGKLIELKIIKLNQEGKLCPVKPNLQTSSDDSRFFPTIAWFKAGVCKTPIRRFESDQFLQKEILKGLSKLEVFQQFERREKAIVFARWVNRFIAVGASFLALTGHPKIGGGIGLFCPLVEALCFDFYIKNEAKKRE
ncbi:2421_t:CDS:2 [Ambispora gerdemannii]|uniref:2421_t:CDS:1 n=1 Tax=Ambispora gerdemannii TaxID=144530 RepID=A0A9N9AFW0_9GLOM|nr:2421_t:CDS:2 [Ambispora gerdemannii]